MKRIICSILVVVMLALSLVGCGYSMADDKMSNYASFSDTQKAAFEAALKLIKIEDGEFNFDDGVREEMVLENIYAAIAEKTSADAEQKKTGVPSGRDVVYYAYYATADFDGTVAVLYTDKLKSSSPSSIQLQADKSYGDDTFSQELADILSAYDFDNGVYASVTSGTTVEGDVAYVTYTKTLNGSSDEPVTYTNEKIVIGAAPASGEKATTLASYLCGKSIASKLEQIELVEGDKTYTYSSIQVNFITSRITNGITAEGNKAYVSYTKKVGSETATNVKNEMIIVGAPAAEGTSAATLASHISGKKITSILDSLTLTEGENSVVYSNIQVNWVAGDGNPIGSFEDMTYEEETDEEKQTKVKDTTGTERVLNGKTLTYYVYPVYYKETPEYTAALLIDKVFGKDLTADSIFEILFVNEYAALSDDATEEERAAITENAVKYKTSDGLSIADMVSKIVAYYEDIETAEEAVDNAIEAASDAVTAYNEAEDNLSAEKEKESPDADKVAELEAALAKAKTAKETAEANRKKAEEEKAKVETDRTDNINKLLAIVGEGETESLETKLYKNYKILNYNYLQTSYNEEIKNNLAKEIYHFLTSNITMNGTLPEKAVKDAYTQLYEAYESEFYTGTFNTTDKISNYSQYNGNFESFLFKQIEEDYDKKVTTMAQAKVVLEEEARVHVEPLVKLFLAAQTYDLVVTDEDYDEFKDKLEEYYYYYILYYKNFDIEEMVGETNITAAAQFNKLMDWFLEHEDVKAESVDENGYLRITYKYTNSLIGGYEIGDPASKAE